MSADMEVVIGFEFLRGCQNLIVVKELSVAAKNVSESFRFKSPNSMTSHDLDENGLNLGRPSHSLPRSVHTGERGGGRVRSPLRLRHYKVQISLRTAESPDSQPAGF